jgi:hypothetical protein
MEQAEPLKSTSRNRLKYCPELYLSRLHFSGLFPYSCEIRYMWYGPSLVLVSCMFGSASWGPISLPDQSKGMTLELNRRGSYGNRTDQRLHLWLTWAFEAKRNSKRSKARYLYKTN